MEKEDEFLCEVVISPIIHSIKISDKQEPKYYTIDKVVPKKYQDTKLYFWKSNLLSQKTYLHSKEDGLAVVRNKKVVGTPKYWNINGQDIFNSYIKEEQRNLYVNKIKEAMVPFIKIDMKVLDQENYPLRIELIYYSKCPRIDLDNKGWLLFKCFQDLITDKRMKGKTSYYFDKPYIIDDSPRYISDTGRIKWIETPEEEEKMIFKIYKTSY